MERREKPQIEIYPSDNQNVVQGGSVLFQCRVMSGIPNPKITWRPLNGGSENLKKSGQKKLVKSNKSISRKNVLNIFHEN